MEHRNGAPVHSGAPSRVFYGVREAYFKLVAAGSGLLFEGITGRSLPVEQRDYRKQNSARFVGYRVDALDGESGSLSQPSQVSMMLKARVMQQLEEPLPK